MINPIEKGILINFLVDTVHELIYHELCKTQQILCQERDFIPNKGNTTNIKETTLARYFIKVTARPNLTRLRVIKPINRVH